MSPHKTIRIREEGDTLVVCVGGYLNSLLGEEVEKVVRARLDDGGRRILEEMQYLVQGHQVEGRGGERQLVEIGLADAAIVQVGRLQAGARRGRSKHRRS